ncbi:hypothetical protein D9601_02350 [Sphingomonas sp. MA1305]|uniref:hypothetical protein n=1 Tax=Sphingomonas sp. MA1305 TaxID=2479204 RepID=UPI0018DF836C|nr:hypothetical protein [Sphingomonas sp. MA1305]MBI0474206.1 hypothetical protein [Sphingomonas sp. MA1305]
MNIQLTKAQLQAFLALVAAVVLVSIAPIVVTGLMGKVVPDGLIAVSDKTVTGLIGVLGTLVGVMWQSRPKGVEPSGTPADPISTKDVNP